MPQALVKSATISTPAREVSQEDEEESVEEEFVRAVTLGIPPREASQEDDEGNTFQRRQSEPTVSPNKRRSSKLLRSKSTAMLALPALEGPMSLSSLADLAPLSKQAPGAVRPGLVKRATAKFDKLEESAQPRTHSSAEKPYAVTGFLSLLFGVLSVVPYNIILQSDPGSPLFIGFATHIFFVCINVKKLRRILFDQQIPLRYHAGFVLLGFIFTTLKSYAFVRLPTSLCMLLMNLQMLVAMVTQFLIFGDRYSLSQISGCGFVTAGVIIGGKAKKLSTEVSVEAADLLGADTLIGIAQMLGSLVALTLLSVLVKLAFSKFGEAVEEQIVMQHLGALPLFVLGGQWGAISSRLSSWMMGKDIYLVVLLVTNMSITFAAQATQVQFAGRAPNLLLVQLVDTMKKFLSLLVTALLAAPPFPPMGFWAGSGMLVLGTLQFLTASDAHEEKDKSHEE